MTSTEVTTDGELIRRFRAADSAGDRNAVFSEIYAGYESIVRAACWLRLRPDLDAVDDTTQRVFLDLWNLLCGETKVDALPALVRTIAHRESTDALRRMLRRRDHEQSDRGDPLDAAAPHERHRGETEVVHRMLSADIMSIIDQIVTGAPEDRQDLHRAAILAEFRGGRAMGDTLGVTSARASRLLAEHREWLTGRFAAVLVASEREGMCPRLRAMLEAAGIVPDGSVQPLPEKLFTTVVKHIGQCRKACQPSRDRLAPDWKIWVLPAAGAATLLREVIARADARSDLELVADADVDSDPSVVRTESGTASLPGVRQAGSAAVTTGRRDAGTRERAAKVPPRRGGGVRAAVLGGTAIVVLLLLIGAKPSSWAGTDDGRSWPWIAGGSGKPTAAAPTAENRTGTNTDTQTGSDTGTGPSGERPGAESRHQGGQNPGDGDTPGSENPGGGQDPGNQDPGDQNQGGSENPGGVQDPGGQDPGGMVNPGGEQNPGGDDPAAMFQPPTHLVVVHLSAYTESTAYLDVTIGGVPRPRCAGPGYTCEYEVREGATVVLNPGDYVFAWGYAGCPAGQTYANCVFQAGTDDLGFNLNVQFDDPVPGEPG